MESKRKATAHLEVSVLLVSLDRLCHKCFQNTYVNTHVMSIRFVSGNLFPSTTITSLQIHSAFIVLWFTVFIIFILFSILFYSIDHFNKNYLLIIFFFITKIEIFDWNRRRIGRSLHLHEIISIVWQIRILFFCLLLHSTSFFIIPFPSAFYFTFFSPSFSLKTIII